MRKPNGRDIKMAQSNFQKSKRNHSNLVSVVHLKVSLRVEQDSSLTDRFVGNESKPSRDSMKIVKEDTISAMKYGNPSPFGLMIFKLLPCASGFA